jgi:hypothetical protein
MASGENCKLYILPHLVSLAILARARSFRLQFLISSIANHTAVSSNSDYAYSSPTRFTPGSNGYSTSSSNVG